jgi:hypothetical protein
MLAAVEAVGPGPPLAARPNRCHTAALADCSARGVQRPHGETKSKRTAARGPARPSDRFDLEVQADQAEHEALDVLDQVVKDP